MLITNPMTVYKSAVKDYVSLRMLLTGMQTKTSVVKHKTLNI